MLNWLKLNYRIVLAFLTVVFMTVYLYSCQPTVMSIEDNGRQVTRGELQVELTRVITLAELRFADLEKQERLRELILQNALILASGSVLDPVGIITGVAAIYGIASAGGSITRTVKNGIKKAKVNNA